MSRATAAALLSLAVVLAAAPALAAPALAATGGGQAVRGGTPAPVKPGGAGQAGAAGQGGTLPAAGLPQPTAGCHPEFASSPPSPQAPWPQQALDYSSVWRFTQGGHGVTVAVIDSGVDANPQLDGRVIVAQSLAPAQFNVPADADCVGHGTEVAGIIAAAPMNGEGFEGVAPQATILSIKITNTETGITPDTVVQAIREAVAHGANVINLSLSTGNTPALRDAVESAIQRNIVVVASAGNDQPGSTGPFYPANYPGVLPVGSVAQDGTLDSRSDTQTKGTVTAPGVNVTSTYPSTARSGGYAGGLDGTSYATAFVSGVAALVRASHPRLSAAQVVQWIRDTADGAAGPGTGYGMVNPVEAVTDLAPSGAASSEPGTGQGQVSIDRPVPDGSARTVAMSVTGGAFGLAAIAIAIAVVAGAGRRRGRPGGM